MTARGWVVLGLLLLAPLILAGCAAGETSREYESYTPSISEFPPPSTATTRP